MYLGFFKCTTISYCYTNNYFILQPCIFYLIILSILFIGTIAETSMWNFALKEKNNNNITQNLSEKVENAC